MPSIIRRAYRDNDRTPVIYYTRRWRSATTGWMSKLYKSKRRRKSPDPLGSALGGFIDDRAPLRTTRSHTV